MSNKPIDIKKWLIPKLRRLSRWWPNKNIAREKAKVKVEIGKTKEGKPKYRIFFRCATCEIERPEHSLWTREETQADHISPVVNPKDGFVDWNTFIPRLLCDASGYQILCENHHKQKTGTENKVRKVKRIKK